MVDREELGLDLGHPVDVEQVAPDRGGRRRCRAHRLDHVRSSRSGPRRRRRSSAGRARTPPAAPSRSSTANASSPAAGAAPLRVGERAHLPPLLRARRACPASPADDPVVDAAGRASAPRRGRRAAQLPCQSTGPREGRVRPAGSPCRRRPRRGRSRSARRSPPSEAQSAAIGSPRAWTSSSWARMSSRRIPRRRCVGRTPTTVTPAVCTGPPGTVRSNSKTPAPPTIAPPSSGDVHPPVRRRAYAPPGPRRGPRASRSSARSAEPVAQLLAAGPCGSRRSQDLLQRRVVEHEPALGAVLREADGDDAVALDADDDALAERRVAHGVAGREIGRRAGRRLRRAGRVVARPGRRAAGARARSRPGAPRGSGSGCGSRASPRASAWPRASASAAPAPA